MFLQGDTEYLESSHPMNEQSNPDADVISEPITQLPRQEGINMKKTMRVIQHLLNNEVDEAYREGNAKTFAYLCDRINAYYADINQRHAKKELFKRLCETVTSVICPCIALNNPL